jgi:hypothetical protein
MANLEYLRQQGKCPSRILDEAVIEQLSYRLVQVLRQHGEKLDVRISPTAENPDELAEEQFRDEQSSMVLSFFGTRTQCRIIKSVAEMIQSAEIKDLQMLESFVRKEKRDRALRAIATLSTHQ